MTQCSRCAMLYTYVWTSHNHCAHVLADTVTLVQPATTRMTYIQQNSLQTLEERSVTSAYKAKQKYWIHPSLWVTGYSSAGKIFKRKASSKPLDRWRTGAGNKTYTDSIVIVPPHIQKARRPAPFGFSPSRIKQMTYNAHRHAMQDHSLSKGLQITNKSNIS